MCSSGYLILAVTERAAMMQAVVVKQCGMMRAALGRLLATLVYLMLILAGDVELNPGPTLGESALQTA